jgi:hypothetical protein
MAGRRTQVAIFQRPFPEISEHTDCRQNPLYFRLSSEESRQAKFSETKVFAAQQHGCYQYPLSRKKPTFKSKASPKLHVPSESTFVIHSYRKAPLAVGAGLSGDSRNLKKNALFCFSMTLETWNSFVKTLRHVSGLSSGAPKTIGSGFFSCVLDDEAIVDCITFLRDGVYAKSVYYCLIFVLWGECALALISAVPDKKQVGRKLKEEVGELGNLLLGIHYASSEKWEL